MSSEHFFEKSSKKVLNKTGSNHDFSCNFLHDEERQTRNFQKNPQKWVIFCRFLRFLPIFLHFFLKNFAFFLHFFAIFRKKGTILKKRHQSNKNCFSMGAFFGTFFSKIVPFFPKIVPFFRNFQFLQCLFL